MAIKNRRSFARGQLNFYRLVKFLTSSHAAPESTGEGQDTSTTVLHTNKVYGN
jgi:hypothetical protein